jgi:hypothetical protein
MNTAPPFAEKPPARLERPAADLGVWLETWVRLLDEQFRIPGTQYRFGLDPLLGLFAPLVGDALGALLACAVVFTAWRRGASAGVLFRMLGNIVLDTAVGSVPFVGDFIDIGLRANRRNLELLRHVKVGGEVPDMPSSQLPTHSGIHLVRPTAAGWVLIASLLGLVLMICALPIGLFVWLLSYLLH